MRNTLVAQRLRSFFHICFFALMIGICLCKCAYLFELLPPLIACGGVILLVILFLVILKCWDKLTVHVSRLLDIIAARISPEKMLILLVLLSLLTKLGAATILDINSLIHPDINVYVTTAKELADSGMAQTYAGYCYSFSHMFWFSVFLMPVAKLFGISYITLTVYMAMISTVSLTLLFETIKYAFSYRKAIVFAAIYCVLPSQILLPGYIVHEHVLVFFLSVSVLLYYRILPCMKGKKAKGLVFAGAFQGFVLAAQVNSLGIIALIAFGFELLLKESLKGTRRFVMVLLILTTVVAEGILFDQIQLSHSDLNEGYVKSDKVRWTLLVGSNTEDGWFEEAGKLYNDYEKDSTRKEIQDYRSKLLIERYAQLLSSPKRLGAHLKAKFLTIWSCFIYPIGYSNETITDPNLRTVYNRFMFKPLVMVEFGVSVMLAFSGLISRIRGKEANNGFGLFLELYMLGATAMLLLTECNNKYTISLQPVFLIACLSTITWLSEKKG